MVELSMVFVFLTNFFLLVVALVFLGPIFAGDCDDDIKKLDGIGLGVGLLGWVVSGAILTFFAMTQFV